jgi:hypothetical protein
MPIDLFNRDRLRQIGAALARLEATLKQMQQQESKNMSQITDWAAAEEADLTNIKTTLNSIVAGVAALDALIQALPVAPVLTQADLDALTAVKTASDDLVTQAQAINVGPPAAPPAQ